VYKLVTITDVKQASKGQFTTPAGGDDNSFDFLLGELIIPAVGAAFAHYCNRPDFDQTARVEYLSPRSNSRFLFVASPPVVAAAVGPPVIEALRVYQDTSFPRAYGAETELVSGTDFVVHENEGKLEHVHGWSGGPRSIKVSYTGGYLTDDAAGCPEDIKLAAIMQAKAIFDRRDDIALTGRSQEGGSISMLSPVTLPKQVTMLLDPYRILRV
jgi:hypothetical protein